MNFVCYNPFNTNEWWEVSGNKRRLVHGDQKAFIQFIGGAVATISAGWFLSYPIA